MKVLSLFDGMSGGMLALKSAGIEVDKYYASELDKFAIAESQANFPDIIQLGDVTKWREWDIPWGEIDLLLGGSPCQGFSSSGKGLNFQDPRSKLFFEYVEIIEHIKKFNPNVKFMLENVKMKVEWENVITSYLGVDPVFINSADFTAQNRQRLYWCNWEIKPWDITNEVLQDIIEDDSIVDRDKAYCIDANYAKGGNIEQYFEKSRRQLVFYPAAIYGRRINENGKRSTSKTDRLVHCLEVQDSEKTRCLTTVPKDVLLAYIPPGRYLDAFEKLSEGVHYRKLTVKECCRLQGVPDDYFKVSSNTQAYKMLGNGWTIPVIAHILKCMEE